MTYAEINATPVLLNIGEAHHNGDWNFRDVSSPFTRIHYVRKGRARIIRAGEVVELRPGYLYLTPPYVRHSYENDTPFETVYLHIYFNAPGKVVLFEWLDLPTVVPGGAEVESVLSRLLTLHPDRMLRDYDPREYDNASGLAETLSDGSRDSLAVAMETEALLRLLLARFLEGATARRERLDPRVEAALQYIGAHLDAHIALEELAGAASLSKDHFIRLFTREVGLTPGRYINRRKIETAQLRLLLSPVESVKSVAFSLGFDNLQYFNRLFSRLTGESPGRYRNSHR